MDESDHLTLALVNAGDEEVVSQEEGDPHVSNALAFLEDILSSHSH